MELLTKELIKVGSQENENEKHLETLRDGGKVKATDFARSMGIEVIEN